MTTPLDQILERVKSDDDASTRLLIDELQARLADNREATLNGIDKETDMGELMRWFVDLDEIAMLAVEALEKAQGRCEQLRQQFEKLQAIRHDELVSLTKAVAKAVRQGADPAKSA